MAKGWKFRVRRERLGGGAPVEALYVVALSDQIGAMVKLTSKEGLLDEVVEIAGEASQELLDEWNIKPGEVFCAVAWS
jgi:hypothetical protein